MVSDDDRSPGQYDGPEGLNALPGMARVAVTAWWHTAGWAVRVGVKAPRVMVELALSPERAQELARGLRDIVPDVVAGVVGWAEHEEVDEHSPEYNSNHSAEPRTLREEGELLLHKSRDVRFEIEAHPAYERMLSELAPDEGRILRLLLLEGPQPSVDVRTGGPLGLVRSRLIAPGLSMIGARAGCRYVDRVPSYLNNLFRLGMVWFSRETLRDHTRYQVLEAQPEVLGAIHSVRQAKLVRRSIHLTPFGEDFCRVCLAPDERELVDLPQHSTPPAATTSPSPPSDVGTDSAP